MRKYGKAKKAFTLIEIIVVTALVGIVGVAVVSMMVPASNVFQQMSSNVEAKMKADQLMKVIQPQVRYATELEILDDASQIGADGDFRYLYNGQNKILVYDNGAENDLFSEDYYGGYDVSFTAQRLENNLVEITLQVAKKDDPSMQCTIKTSVFVLNTAIVGGVDGPGNILKFKWGPQPIAS